METKFTLKTIALLIFAVLFNRSLVKAQIICYDFVPDSVITNTNTTTTQYDTDLDIDNDAQFDFRFRSVNASFTGFIQLSGNTYTNNFVLANGSNDVLVLNSGATIDASSTGWTQLNNQNQSLITYTPNASGPFAGQSKKYLGIRFLTGSNTYYGWIEISGSGTTALNSYTIHSFAYNSVPNQSISAGQGCSTSINQVGINSESFSVYPNPANEKIYIHSNTVKSLNITIQLMDAMGKLILSEKQNYSANISSRAIDISHLPNAIYFVKVISAEGDTKLIKVVKN